ncbi:hypothetical protein F8503_23670 [Bacillus toyonensis]|nr:hypothetical protein F8503_23670 [Bacillus toyonensis]
MLYRIFDCEEGKVRIPLNKKGIKKTKEGSLYFVLPSDWFHKYVGLWGYLIRLMEFHKPICSVFGHNL